MHPANRPQQSSRPAAACGTTAALQGGRTLLLHHPAYPTVRPITRCRWRQAHPAGPPTRSSCRHTPQCACRAAAAWRPAAGCRRLCLQGTPPRGDQNSQSGQAPVAWAARAGTGRHGPAQAGTGGAAEVHTGPALTPTHPAPNIPVCHKGARCCCQAAVPSPVPQVQTSGWSRSRPAPLKAASSSAAGFSLQACVFLSVSGPVPARHGCASAVCCVLPAAAAVHMRRLHSGSQAPAPPDPRNPAVTCPPALAQHVCKLQAVAAGNVAATQAGPRLWSFATEPAGGAVVWCRTCCRVERQQSGSSRRTALWLARGTWELGAGSCTQAGSPGRRPRIHHLLVAAAGVGQHLLPVAHGSRIQTRLVPARGTR